MYGPPAHLREVHVGVSVLLYEAQQVGLEGWGGREETETDGKKFPASPQTLPARIVAHLNIMFSEAERGYLALNLFAQLDVNLIPETDVPVTSLCYVLGHSIDGHSNLELSVITHIDPSPGLTLAFLSDI